MLFSLVIWVIAALSLLLSVIFYLFLWHGVSKSDGSLTQYCRRKIETRLERIVGKKIKKALEKQDMKRRKEERMGMKKGDSEGTHRMPTLPKLGGKDDDASSVFSIARSDTLSTTTTLPPYSANAPSRTNTMNTTRTLGMKPSLPSLSERPIPSRSDTQGTNYSTASFGSNAPLLSQAGDMGMSSPAPPMPPLDRNTDYFNGPSGSRPQANGLSGRPYSPMTQGMPTSPRPSRSVLPPVDTTYNGRASPAPQLISPLPNDVRGPSPAQGIAPYPNRRPGASPLGPTFSPFDNRVPARGPSYEMSPVDITPSDNGSQQYYPTSNGPNGYRQPQLPNTLRPGSPAFSQSSGPPSRAGTAPPSNPRAGLPATLQSAIQRREASQPLPNRGMNGPMPQQRSATAPLRQPGWGPEPSFRSNTTSPPRYDGY